ncbi:unnamed protein product [Adineta steineri]|uniref:Beta-lactamase-related domain-containing protein n=1 Tax=Adineta steineri TaxID=433720 RepID=A0A819SWR6_9BILA|nr:unnamed protein product [Adineta steineri]
MKPVWQSHNMNNLAPNRCRFIVVIEMKPCDMAYICNHLWFFLILSVVNNVHGELNIYGTTDNEWDFVRDIFKENFIEERDLGGSVAVYHQGKLVVDLWAGSFDQSQGKAYDNNTLQLVFSTSKGVVAVAAALCVQQGLLNYSALVTDYWPEYGQSGKGNTTVADILSHRAGLPFESASDEQRQFIRDEIASKLDIEFYIGLPSTEEYRVSPLNVKPNGNGSVDTSAFAWFNEQRTHEAEIPAANGITNARSVARLYASLIGDIENNKYKRLLNEEILKEATKSNTPPGEMDSVFNVTSVLAMGFFLLDRTLPSLGPGVFGHSGAGGSIGFAAPAKQLSFAYVMNRLELDASTEVDPRYKHMLDRIATMINNNGASLTKNVSVHLLLFCIVIFFIKFIIV